MAYTKENPFQGLSTTNPTKSALESNPIIRFERPVTKRLIHGTTPETDLSAY